MAAYRKIYLGLFLRNRYSVTAQGFQLASKNMSLNLIIEDRIFAD